jgi:uncharacterized protein GlcG (DUF336 family)
MAVVDNHGFPVAYERMDNVQTASCTISVEGEDGNNVQVFANSLACMPACMVSSARKRSLGCTGSI